MALKASIFKVELSISDMDRHYYAEHALTLARHPSENNQRMMLRLLAFIFNASESLTFTKGLTCRQVYLRPCGGTLTTIGQLLLANLGNSVSMVLPEKKCSRALYRLPAVIKTLRTRLS